MSLILYKKSNVGELHTLKSCLASLKKQWTTWDIVFSVNGCIFGSKGDLQRQVFGW